MPPPAHIAALRRLLPAPASPRSPVPERCEMCSLPLDERHEHVIELPSREITCCCTACALLFDAGNGGKRRLPRDSRFLVDFELSGAEWAALQIPVSLVFLSRQSSSGGAPGAVIAAYPSPGGVVTAGLDPEIWDELAAAHPELNSVTPDLEALLINRLLGPHQAFIVPLDQAYRLAGLIRGAWSGFSGGPQVKLAVAEFCAQLQRAARPLRRIPHPPAARQPQTSSQSLTNGGDQAKSGKLPAQSQPRKPSYA